MAKVRASKHGDVVPFQRCWVALGSALLCVAPSCTDPSFGRDAGSDEGRTEADGDVSAGGNARDSGSSGNVGASDAGLDAATPGHSDAAVLLPSNDAASSAPDGAAPPAESPPDAAPSTPKDAQAPASGDAAAADLIPEWARSLIGTYAKRTVTFSYDDAGNNPIQTRNVDHSVVRIASEDGELVVSIQTCSYTVSIKGQTSSPLDFKNAAQWPALRGRLALGAPNTFSSEVMLQHFGFDPARAMSCGAAARRNKFEEQTWIAGPTCQCYPTVLPTDIDDCRVVDGDRDQLAGVTARGPSALGTTLVDYLMVFDFSVKIADGTVAPGQLPAWREVRAQGPACINAERDRCYIGHNELCPGASTSLLRLPQDATCAALDPGAFGPLENFPAETDCRANQGRP